MEIQPENFASVLNTLSDAFIMMDTKGSINYVNEAACQITGYSSSDAKGLKCRDILKPDGCNKSNVSDGSNTSRIKYTRNIEIIRKDGTKIVIESTHNPLIDSNGVMIGAVEIFREINGDECFKNGFKQSEHHFRRLFETTKDMIFVISLDGLFFDINQAVVDLLGYKTKKELYSLDNIEHIFIDPIHWHVCRKQLHINGFIQDFEVGFKKKDGTRLHGCLSAHVVYNNDGDIIGYEGIAKDITARMDSFANLYKHHQEILLLNKIALIMNSSQDLKSVLSTALKGIMKLLNFTAGTIFLINHDKSSFDIKTLKGFPEEISLDPFTPVFHDRKLMKFFLKKDNSLTPKSIFPSFKITLKDLIRNKKILMSCFLITEKGWPSGFMAFPIEETYELSLADFHILGSVGNFLGGAIANMKLMKTVQNHREELKHLTAKLFQSQEIECKRIAREIHDETGSALIGINFNLDAAQKAIPADDQDLNNMITKIKQQVNHTYQEMRRISHLLHPALLTDLGLEPALDSYLNQRAKQSSLKIDFKMIGFTGRINPGIETVLYRFSQAALSNTIKYANASVFKLSIIKGYPSIIFVAKDDGIGFDINVNNLKRPSLGLLSMKERTAILGGKFSLHTKPGKGTRIRIEIPIKKRKPSILNANPDIFQENYEISPD